jgi:hypothetical protein
MATGVATWTDIEAAIQYPHLPCYMCRPTSPSKLWRHTGVAFSSPRNFIPKGGKRYDVALGNTHLYLEDLVSGVGMVDGACRAPLLILVPFVIATPAWSQDKVWGWSE